VIGKVLNNRYRIDKKIGQGGMGTVYCGFDTALERRVAIKMLTKSGLGTEERGKLISEAQTAAKLNHPNIVTIYDVGEDDSSTGFGQAFPFIVMEYVEGESLYEVRPETLEETLQILHQVCAGLEHAHEHGIIHRDLKPENVVLTRDGTAKLMDFGLARSIASRYSMDGIIAGTVFYLAPEQALGQVIDPRTDLYSLGVMMYELTTGELPFIAQDPIAVISQHLHAPVVPPRAKNGEISHLLDGLIIKLLSKDPHARPASAGEVKQILESAEILYAPAIPIQEFSVLERIVRGRIVGRGEELQVARAAWQKAAAGDSQLLLISGEAGIGKTRLTYEVVTLAEISGGRALIGANYAEGSAPYGAFKQILRAALSLDLELPDEVLANLLILNPELQHRFPDLSIHEPKDPQSEQQSLFESLVVLFTTLSDRTPTLLIIEDAQWADSGTLSMLRYLARNTRHQRVMIVVTFREIDLDEARTFHEVLHDFDREGLAKPLRLNRLNRKDSGELLAILFAEGITAELLDGIYNETEGNPFFIEEVCKSLVDSGKFYFENGQWHRPSIEELGIPHSVKLAILTRVRKLPENHQEILFQAAVLGREFDLDILTSVSEVDEDTLIDALESAERSLLIEKKRLNGKVRLAFVHALVPSTLLEDLRTVERRKMHNRAAKAIENYCPDDFETLAFHYLQAGMVEVGVKYLLRAGDRARSLYAHQEAIDHYEQAIKLLEMQGNIEDTARTLMKLGLTYHNAFEFSKSRGAYERGFVTWQQAGTSRDRLPPAPHALRVVYDDPPTFDPGRCLDLSSISIILQLFSGLVELSPDLSVMPEIARNWEVLDGGRRYIFHLRDDVYWSDGVPVTAWDFKYAWLRVLDPSSHPYPASLLADLKGARDFYQGELQDPDYLGVQVVDDLTLEVELEEPSSYFLQILTSVVAFPVPRHVVELHGEAWTDSNNLVTNGPFNLVDYTPNHSAKFERNPAYHGVYNGNLEQVVIQFSAQQRGNLLPMYKVETLDVINLEDLPPVEADQARQLYAEDYISGPTLSCYYVGFNANKSPLDDIRIRQALALAISREKLASIINRGLFFPATGGLVPPGMPGYSSGITLPYDPERARALLEEAGFPPGQVFQELECLAPDTPFKRTLAAYLIGQWSEVLGLDITFEFVEWGSFLDLIESKRQHMWLAGYIVDYPDPDSIFRVGDFTRHCEWQNESYLKLVEEARGVMDQEARMNMYHKADRIAVEEVPIIPLLYGRFHLLIKPWVKNLVFSAINPPHWKFIIIEPH
jgi:ABC-type oligopeptide transport system substrate-binding subunit/predicted Ser/Thr protein kinase